MKIVLTMLMFMAIMGWSFADRFINLQLVKTLENSMDSSADPCSDFYKYACGNWSQLASSYTAVLKENTEVEAEFIRYLDETPTSAMPQFVMKAQNYYTSCTGTRRIEEAEYLQWLQKNERIDLALLASPGKTYDVYDWPVTFGTMRKYGFNAVFFEEDMSTKKGDPLRRIINLRRPAKQIWDRLISEDYFHSIEKYLSIDITEYWEEINKFQELLRKVYDMEDKTGKKVVTVKELPLPWLKKYLSAALQQTSLDLNMELTIENIPYFEALDALLKKYDHKFICRYLEIQFVSSLVTEVLPHSKTDCAEELRKHFPIAMHWIYENLHPEIVNEIPKIQQMFSNVIKNVKTNLQRNGFVPAKYFARLDSIQLKVGNLPRLNTVNVLNSFYKPLAVNASNIYGNYLQMLKLYYRADHFRVTNGFQLNPNEYFNEGEYFTGYLNYIYPYYLAKDNMIILPAELLKPPFYHSDYEDIFIYGSIGRLLARYVFDSLDGFDNFNENDKEKLADKFSLSTTTGIVFSSFPTQLNQQYPIKNVQMPMKKWFFINAAQYFCYKEYDNKVHAKFAHIPQFLETFECK